MVRLPARILAISIVSFCATGCPNVSGLSPERSAPGEQIVVTGENFGAAQGKSKLLYDGTPMQIVDWSDSSITATLPDPKPAGVYTVALLSGGRTWPEAQTHELCTAAGPDTCPPIISNVQTVINPKNGLGAFVTFETDEPATPSVTVTGPEGSFVVPPQGTLSFAPNTSHTVAVLGMREDSTYTFAISAVDAAGNVGTGSIAYTTIDILPHVFPFEVVTSDPARMAPGYLFFTINAPLAYQGAGFAFAVDNEGKLVWYHKDQVVQDIYRRANGNYLYTTGGGSGDVILETDPFGFTVNTWTTAGVGTDTFHHAIVDLPNGNFLSLSSELRVIGGYPGGETYDVVGDVVVEFDAAGALVQQWSLFDLLDPHRVTPDFHNAFWAGIYGDDAKDWTHANSLVYDPSDDTMVLSLRHQDVVLKMTRAEPSELVWVIGQDDPTVPGDDAWPFLAMTGGGQYPNHMHDARVLPNGDIVLYDNANATQITRAVEYSLDLPTMTMREEWVYIDPDFDPPLFGAFVGGVDLLENDNVVICHGGLGGPPIGGAEPTHIRITEVDRATGDKVFDAFIQESSPYVGYRVRRYPSLYPPAP